MQSSASFADCSHTISNCIYLTTLLRAACTAVFYPTAAQHSCYPMSSKLFHPSALPINNFQIQHVCEWVETESPEMPEQVQWVSKYTITKEVFHNRSFITIYIAENSVLILSWIQWISVVRKAIDTRKRLFSKQKPEGLSAIWRWEFFNLHYTKSWTSKMKPNVSTYLMGSWCIIPL